MLPTRRQRQSEQDGGNKPPTPRNSAAVAANANSNKGKQRTSSAAAAAKATAGPVLTDGTSGYTLVLRGLTTDLAAIYRDAVPRFLLPRVPLVSDFEASAASANNNEEVGGATAEEQEAMGTGRKTSSLAPSNAAAAIKMRPVVDAKVAFRVETLSAYVEVPIDEAKKALRSTAVATTAESSNNHNSSNNTSSTSAALAQYCNGRELFGHKCGAVAAQSNHDQSGMVSVSCVASHAVTATTLVNAMKPVFPGFVSVVPASNALQMLQQQQVANPNMTIGALRAKKHRLVFRTERAAFEAKRLLDEFPADDLRVQVNLNDAAMRRFVEFVRESDNQGTALDSN